MVYKTIVKPFLDVLVALISIIVLSPIILLTMVLLWFSNKGTPFFIQSRPGKNEKLFNIIKFKTMNDKKDEDGNLLPDTYRLTPIGKLIRKTSIDEIPQLFNVLKGDMSIIGPRPLLPQYLEYYTTQEQKRHFVKPGITGLAQVNGRNYLDWNSKLRLDVDYVENLTFKMDLNILTKTIYKVISSKDVAIDNTNVETRLDVIRKTKNREVINKL